MRVAYTLEQCWHRVPGGTATAALRVASAMPATVELVGVAGRHPSTPEEFRPTIPMRPLPLRGAALYHAWLGLGTPKVERATGAVDVCHSTTIIPAPSRAPLVVTVHDLAFRHYPRMFTRHGTAVFRRSLWLVRRRAALVLCSSTATLADCAAAGIPSDRLRHVPLGVDPQRATSEHVAEVRRRYSLPAEFVLFVGTLEPRKNLTRLMEAMSLLRTPIPLVIAGVEGWGSDASGTSATDVRYLDFVPQRDLSALYAAASVFCYPSLFEGFGLPVLEAMAQGTPVVTSRGISTEEVAGGNAVLVEPTDVASIADGIDAALADAEAIGGAGLRWAATQTWDVTARATADAYADVAG